MGCLCEEPGQMQGGSQGMVLCNSYISQRVSAHRPCVNWSVSCLPQLTSTSVVGSLCSKLNSSSFLLNSVSWKIALPPLQFVKPDTWKTFKILLFPHPLLFLKIYFGVLLLQLSSIAYDILSTLSCFTHLCSSAYAVLMSYPPCLCLSESGLSVSLCLSHSFTVTRFSSRTLLPPPSLYCLNAILLYAQGSLCLPNL